MKQERLLKLAKKGVLQQLNIENEIAERFKERRGFESRIQKARIEQLHKEYNEIVEMLKKCKVEKERKNMRTTYELLNKVIELGFNKDEALKSIDASLDNEVGFENRKPIDEEYISNDLYETILLSFKCECE